MRALAVLAVFIASAGCSSLIGVDDFTLEDAGVPATGGDGASGPIGATIRVSGTARLRTSTQVPSPNQRVTFVRAGAGVAGTAAEATTAADGTFTLEVPTLGAPVDGYVEIVTTTAYTARTFVFGATADVANLPVNLFDDAALASSAANAGTSQGTSRACLLVDTVVEAARVTSSIGTIRYNDAATGQPSLIGAATDASGLAWVFDIPSGNVSVSASLLGVSFGGRTVALDAHVCGRVTLSVTP